MTDVKCRVETCYYWGTGDICKADTIMVDNNTIRRTATEAGNLDVNVGTTIRDRGQTGRTEATDLTAGSTTRGRTRDFEAGDLTTGTFGKVGTEQRTRTSGNRSDVQAKTSHETLCSTFRPKDSAPGH